MEREPQYKVHQLVWIFSMGLLYPVRVKRIHITHCDEGEGLRLEKITYDLQHDAIERAQYDRVDEKSIYPTREAAPESYRSQDDKQRNIKRAG